MTEPCEICDGLGYLLDQTYGCADIPDGWTPVQRCDTCERFEGDDDAAAFAAANHYVEFEWFDGHPDDILDPDSYPGDYAIHIILEEP